MHKINFYQTHLTEGQWYYIKKVFFEKDYIHRKFCGKKTEKAIVKFINKLINRLYFNHLRLEFRLIPD